MIIHRFVFLSPVQLPGKAPASVFEPGAVANIGHTATRTPDGWLFTGAAGVASGLSAGGRDELAAIGEAATTLAVLVPHSQVIVQYAGEPAADGALPTSAPSPALIAARAKAADEERERAAAQPPPPVVDPAPVAAPPPPPSRRRGPPGAQPPVTAPPPSVGWVDE